MIIWGSKGRTKTVGTGRFICPTCKDWRAYRRERVSKYFTLYFLPLFETKQLGEYIECTVCSNTFKPEVLALTETIQREMSQRKNKAAQLFTAWSAELDDGLPLQTFVRRMKEKGLTKDEARPVLRDLTRGQVRRCSTCQLAFKSSLGTCSNCGAPLGPVEVLQA